MLSKISSLTAVAALALAGSAFAGDKMSSVDKNADGKVTKAEAASNKQLSTQFDSLDANKDGNLDKAEFARFEGDEAANPTNRPGTTDDSTPGNEDKLGPGR